MDMDSILIIEMSLEIAKKAQDEAYRLLRESQNSLDETPSDLERQHTYQQAQQAYELAHTMYINDLARATRAWQRLELPTRERLDVINIRTGARIAEGARYEDGTVVIAWPNGNETYPGVEYLERRLPFPLSVASGGTAPPLLIPRTRVLVALHTLGAKPKEAEQLADIIIRAKRELRLLELVAERREKGQLP